jgi:hypothetical protein
MSGKAHSPEHAQALAAELKGSGIEASHILGLGKGKEAISTKGKEYSGSSKNTPSMWNK